MAPANQEQHRVTPLGFSKALPQEFRSGPASLISRSPSPVSQGKGMIYPLAAGGTRRNPLSPVKVKLSGLESESKLRLDSNSESPPRSLLGPTESFAAIVRSRP